MCINKLKHWNVFLRKNNHLKVSNFVMTIMKNGNEWRYSTKIKERHNPDRKGEIQTSKHTKITVKKLTKTMFLNWNCFWKMWLYNSFLQTLLYYLLKYNPFDYLFRKWKSRDQLIIITHNSSREGSNCLNSMLIVCKHQ